MLRPWPTAKEEPSGILCLEAGTALEDLFLVRSGILKPEQGHLILLREKGNPPKRVLGGNF